MKICCIHPFSSIRAAFLPLVIFSSWVFESLASLDVASKGYVSLSLCVDGILSMDDNIEATWGVSLGGAWYVPD